MKNIAVQTNKAATESAVTVFRYGLLAPINWGRDVEDELYRMNALWNKLVEIERANRERYREIISTSPALSEVSERIEALHREREDLIAERKRRRASARSKSKADTADLDERIKAIKAELAPLYEQRKSLAAEAREQQKPLLDALEAERREAVKAARQSSGCFWPNYNAVIASYEIARKRAMKTGADMRFRRFSREGRLVNQIQGGMSVEDLFSCRHSQVGIRLGGQSRGRQTGTLYVTAYTGRDESGRRIRRNVEFPIILHRPFPKDAVIKEVAVNIRRRSPSVVSGQTETDDGRIIEYGEAEYSVAFTCQTPAPEKSAGSSAAGINIGWKRVSGGLRVATAAFHDGTFEHLILPDEWVKKYERVQALRSGIDDADNEMHAALRQALQGMPLWERDGPMVEGLSDSDHRLLSAIKRAPRAPGRAMDALAWRLKETPNMPFVADLGATIEAWRKARKRMILEMDNLRGKLLARRKDLYRTFAARIAAYAGAIAIDDTDYRQAALVERTDGEDLELHEQARRQRVMAAPYELRLAIEQAAAKRGGYVERHRGSVNHCRACRSRNVSGDIARHCHACGAVFDVDENAALNLLHTLIAGPARAVE